MREATQRSRQLARRLRHRLTKAEGVLWAQLRRRQASGLKFRRQHPVGPYILDFACISARLVVEVDGATHAKLDELARDARRTAFLIEHGWRVLRVTNLDVYDNIDGVMAAITAAAEPQHAPSDPACGRSTSPVNGGGHSGH